MFVFLFVVILVIFRINAIIIGEEWNETMQIDTDSQFISTLKNVTYLWRCPVLSLNFSTSDLNHYINETLLNLKENQTISMHLYKKPLKQSNPLRVSTWSYESFLDFSMINNDYKQIQFTMAHDYDVYQEQSMYLILFTTTNSDANDTSKEIIMDSFGILSPNDADNILTIDHYSNEVVFYEPELANIPVFHCNVIAGIDINQTKGFIISFTQESIQEMIMNIS